MYLLSLSSQVCQHYWALQMTHPNRSFRLVCEPQQFSQVESLLEAEGFRFIPEPFSHYCRKLVHEPFPIGSSLAAYFGYIYIQDRASMLPPLALSPSPSSCVLDMAASPGSKTGFLAQLTGADGFVLGNEPNKNRLATLRANLVTSNLLQTGTCAYPGESLPLAPHTWKYILLDPPCSGWGTVKKHPRTVKIWQGSKIDPLIRLQKKLLTKAGTLLSSGGRLLYSTCTVNPAENEEQTRYAVEELGLTPVTIPQFEGFYLDMRPYKAILVDGESSQSQGFYISLLQQNNSYSEEGIDSSKLAGAALDSEAFSSPVFDPSLLPEGIAVNYGDKIRFIPNKAPQVIPDRFSWQAFPIGQYKHQRFYPGSRMRITLPPPKTFPNAPRYVFETVLALRGVLKGVSLTAETEGAVGLWWRDLPLGIGTIKSKRLIINFRV